VNPIPIQPGRKTLYLLEKAGPATAEKYQRSFENLKDLLASFPEHGAPRSRLGARVRLNVIDPYNVYSIYDEPAETVHILRILHGRRRITRTMMRP
jgi:toxin ParE1/3/4